MRCLQCGQELEFGVFTCTRCGADCSFYKTWRSIAATLLFAAVSIAVIAAIVYVVLYWHETQVLALA